MSALDQVLTIGIVKTEHPSLHKQAVAELAALRSERDALKEALEYIRNYDNYASDGDVYIEDGNSYTHVSNYAESVIKAYSAGNE